MQRITIPLLRLGAYVARNNNTTYLAATDGFVIAHGGVGSTAAVRTDPATPATVIRGANQAQAADSHASMICPVRRGEYYLGNASVALVNIWWIPLE